MLRIIGAVLAGAVLALSVPTTRAADQARDAPAAAGRDLVWTWWAPEANAGLLFTWSQPDERRPRLFTWWRPTRSAALLFAFSSPAPAGTLELTWSRPDESRPLLFSWSRLPEVEEAGAAGGEPGVP